jgi:ATP-dependent Lon protease
MSASIIPPHLPGVTPRTALDDKVLRVFELGKVVVHKGITHFSDQFRKLPRFVADYLVATLVDPQNPAPGLAKIDRLLREHLAESDQQDLIKSRIRERGQHPLIGQLRVRYDATRDIYWAEIPALGDSYVRINLSIVRTFSESLLTAGAWGTMVVAFDGHFSLGGKRFPFVVESFTPLQITQIQVDAWVNARAAFTADEWIDLLMTSIGFDPAALVREEKVLYLLRLVPFIEPNVNLIELGPPETGKTFAFRSLSSYGFVVSGSNTTVASLFYHKARRRMGVVGCRDCVLFDEIAHSNFRDEGLVSILKDYLNTGHFGRDTDEFASECSVVFAGNIECDRAARQVAARCCNLFDPLPMVLGRDVAFLDRIHGFLPGWCAPQVSESRLARGVGFMADYLSEIMHQMRSRNYAPILLDHVDFDGMGKRSETALTKIAAGLLKLVYPHRTSQTIQREELDWVLAEAVGLRQRVLDQLAKMAPGEFGHARLDCRWKGVAA